jgi:hypothetical protein
VQVKTASWSPPGLCVYDNGAGMYTCVTQENKDAFVLFVHESSVLMATGIGAVGRWETDGLA